MFLYRSVYEYGEAEYVIEKSRFIAHVSPVETPEEARLFIAGIKEKYKDATHNVPAFVCGAGSEHQWASDDGEPQGTSGAPMVQMLVSSGITNVAVVVTRYFGGIKLGTGGLVRAYTSSLKLGLEAAGTGGVYESEVIKYELDYASYSKLETRAGDAFSIENTEYGEKVTAELGFEPENEESVVSILTNLTNGKGKVKEISKKLLTKRDL